jgi:hypothetical protein
MKKIERFVLVGVCFFHVLFNPLNPCAVCPMTAAFYAKISPIFIVCFFATWMSFFYIFVKSIELQIGFQSLHVKETDSQDPILDLYLGGNLSEECERLRHNFLQYQRILFLTVAPLFSIVYSLGKFFESS